MPQATDLGTAEKVNLSENENGVHRDDDKLSKEMGNGQVTMASFAHLDEKKILRKVLVS